MQNFIDLRNISSKAIYDIGEKFRGKRPDGVEIGFTNYYMTVDGEPFFGISGEIHFSRVDEDQWEDAIIKAKMGGVNLIATYVFWIVHEERQGRFRFDGNRNLRKFISLCAKHGLFVIIRVGPFDHGEMRNGGLPDWLYGMPFDVRSMNEGFFKYTRKLFAKLHEEMDGLYFSQGGPIIGTQIENEYMHSSAGWEVTTGISNEWIPGGIDGEPYMLALKQIAIEEGIVTPFYTCTAWGGAIAPIDEMLPLWGGYAYQPWIFYNASGKHPLTQEYIYRDNHNNAVKKTYNFEPRYEPESRPYACCEMMGGMFNSYNYRFILPFESVDAMANIKLGSGCNMLGYYMYRGGTHPKGETTPFLNEAQVPKLSYDFQAALGQWGQPRASYHRLRLMHYFCSCFTRTLCQSKTVLPTYSELIEPDDVTHLRYAVRVKNNAGFVFLNNFQDHTRMPDIFGVSLSLRLPDEELYIENIGLAGGENAVLPFNLAMQNILLKWATAQPITNLQANGKTYYFFFAPEGMCPVYAFDADMVESINGCETEKRNGLWICLPKIEQTNSFEVNNEQESIVIVTLTREDSLRFYKCEISGRECAFLSDVPLLLDDGGLHAELSDTEATILSFPKALRTDNVGEGNLLTSACFMQNSIFTGYRFSCQHLCSTLSAKRVGLGRYAFDIPQDKLYGHKRVVLAVDYVGDVGQLFINGEMINDDFCNGARWLTRLDSHADELKKFPLTLYIAPIRRDGNVNVDSPMAGRLEIVDEMHERLDGVMLFAVDQMDILLEQ